MRRALAAVVELVIFALATGLLAQSAWAAATVDACATRTDMLGISRIIEVVPPEARCLAPHLQGLSTF